MMKMKVKSLIDVFTGWQNTRARNIADGLGNLGAWAHPIALVQQALAKFDGLKGLKGHFELAAFGQSQSRRSGGTTGRAFKPFLLHPEPS